MANERLEVRLKVRIDYERCHSAKFVVTKFNYSLLAAGRKYHIENLHEVVANAKLGDERKLFCLKVFEATKENLVLVAKLRNF